ncbi:MAG TPA: ABC transporter permease [Gemmatimonadales bacterium]|nr:ABC transporter permease [Gemmatimonadales bacterium]
MKGFSWARVAELVRKELRQMLRDPRMRGVMFAAPVIQLIIFGYAVNTDIRNTGLYVVDRDHSAASRALVAAFTATDRFRLVGGSDRSADLIRVLDRGDAVVGLDIPSGFAADLRAERGATVQVLVDGTDSNTGTIAQSYATRIIQAFARAEAGAPRGGVDLRIRAWYNPNLESRVYNVPGVIAFLILLVCLLLTALAVVRERELGTLDQLLVSPIRSGELILGKTLPVALVAVVDIVIISAIALLWFDVPFRGSVPVFLSAAVLYILSALSLGLLISTVSHTQQEAFMTMFLVLLPALILSGFFYPISSMPEFFQWLTWLNPVRHFLEIVRGTFLKGEGLFALWRQFLILAIMAGGGLAVAVHAFRRRVA